ncbi:hypothetical protein [Frankia sp. CcI49]|uniref:hypothetical protein n=1 Tax=Frankia sp. CcI49 TaxID=1745382 RepID=UPI001F51B32D|nr:hypothetical protein [Frankia sp. CcI49]
MTRPPAGPRPSPRGRVRLGLWGATSSGKTTLMAAMQLAAIQHKPREPGGRHVRWTITSADRATGSALERLRSTLVQDHRFPPATLANTPLRLIFEGRVLRPGSSPARPRPERTPPIDFTLDFLDVSGALYYRGGGSEISTLDGGSGSGGGGGGGFEDDGLRFDDDETSAPTPARRPPDRGAAQHEELVDHLVRCDGIVLLFDPIRERDRADGDNYAYFDAMINRVLEKVRTAGRSRGGLLPHHLAVCVTKFDDPRVLGVALDGRLNTLANGSGPPRIENDVAHRYFDQLCNRSTGASHLRDAIGGFFDPSRVRFYATSSIGLFVGPDGRFNPVDYSNIVMTGGVPRIRGRVAPMNVLEPVVGLVTRINGERR